MNGEFLLKITGLKFSYDGRNPVLDGVNLCLRAGESVAVMGSSGSGKTTLLKIIAGLLHPIQGEIQVKAGKGGVGYIPQQVGLVKNLTALQNVLLGALGRVGNPAILIGNFPADEVEKAYRLLQDLGINNLADRKAAELSGGERQRVAVARALMQSPTLLLADEFVADLDVVNAVDVMRLTVDVCRRNNVALLMTMHDAFLVNKFADRVAVLKNGRIVAEMDGREIDMESLVTILRGS
ncbi:MAG: ATP-binding cassette domain-containing protein [Candidatus Caldarchaeum sp.]|uniref:ATP-binding cassette domain-containing protein n=1 Tax=Caldiarchaeum subterraneum TaxID=311458 RepID=A0A7C5Q935_CALS0